MSKIGPDHYRYYATLDENGVHINCERFIVISETPCCWYVLPDKYSFLLNKGMGWANGRVMEERRRVLKESFGRRYCYPDKRKALDSFRQRQMRRLGHAQRSIAMAEIGIRAASKIVDSDHPVPEVINAGHNEYTAQLRWE